jgi:hypothetical protein
MNQVEQYEPPPNPAKITDTRAAGYIDKFGEKCWELDALEPQVIVDLVTKHVKLCMDDDIMQESLEREAAEKRQLKYVSSRWESIVSDIPEDIQENYESEEEDFE